MLETIITSTNGESFTLLNALIIITSSIVLGLIISFAYMRTHKREGYSPSFTVTLIMLPVIISIIILLVGNNVARAFSLAGAFSIIRFRSAPGDPKDITYVFFTLAVGLTCGMGYIGYAFIFTIVLCALTIVLDAIKFAMPKTKTSKLKITNRTGNVFSVKVTIDTFESAHNNYYTEILLFIITPSAVHLDNYTHIDFIK